MRWNVIRPSLTAATMPASPGLVSTMPAADLATSVAVETAMPICAWRSAGAAHADGVAALLERFDELVFVLREDAGEDRELLGVDAVGDWTGRTHDTVEPHRVSHDGRGRRRPPGGQIQA